MLAKVKQEALYEVECYLCKNKKIVESDSVFTDGKYRYKNNGDKFVPTKFIEGFYDVNINLEAFSNYGEEKELISKSKTLCRKCVDKIKEEFNLFVVNNFGEIL